MSLEIKHYPMPPPDPEQRMSEPVAAPFPRPKVTSEDPIPRYAVRPGPVIDLETYAVKMGWQASVTYSEGYEPHAITGRPSAKPKVKWAIRLVRGQERAVAVRTDDSWTSLWYWSPQQLMKNPGGHAEFKRAIG